MLHQPLKLSNFNIPANALNLLYNRNIEQQLVRCQKIKGEYILCLTLTCRMIFVSHSRIYIHLSSISAQFNHSRFYFCTYIYILD